MTAIYKPKGEASGETKCVDTLILDFQPSKLLESKFLLLKPSVCEALANEYTYYVPGVVLGPGGSRDEKIKFLSFWRQRYK